MIRFLKDDKGNYSHARLIAILVAISSSIIMFGLTYLGQMNEYFFGFFLLYGTGHQTINKFLDTVALRFGGKPEAPKNELN